MRDLLVFQHSPWEGPGKFLVAAAQKNRARMHVVRIWQEKIPALLDFAGLIVLGGSPNVGQEEVYPFLGKEKEAIREWLALDRPYLGFCLGHQLLADVLGAKVAVNFAASIGYIKGYVTHTGRRHPVFAGLPKELSLFKWHGQAVHEPLPTQLTVLATSRDCQVEALSVKGRPHILGLQFDNHAADPGDVADWLDRDAKWLGSLDMAVHPFQVLADARKMRKNIQAEFDHIFKGWLDFIL